MSNFVRTQHRQPKCPLSKSSIHTSQSTTMAPRRFLSQVLMLFSSFYALLLLVSSRRLPCELSSSWTISSDKNALFFSAFVSDESSQQQQQQQSYTPSAVEDYVMEHAVELGYNGPAGDGCTIWNDASATTPALHAQLQQYAQELADYNRRLANFTAPARDMRALFTNPAAQAQACAQLELHPDGLAGIFTSGQLSHTTRVGLAEPLLPPLRDHGICNVPANQLKSSPQLLSLDYLVHDFAAMCRALTPRSRIVLVDMGASLEYHNAIPRRRVPPSISLTCLHALGCLLITCMPTKPHPRIPLLWCKKYPVRCKSPIIGSMSPSRPTPHPNSIPCA